MAMEHFDVVVVGAGISGIGAGRHLQAHCPDRSYVILEGRANIGGTWDLFRYPGIRSDSDMYTLGYSFKPWTGAKAIADGPSILAYLHETATEYGLYRAHPLRPSRERGVVGLGARRAGPSRRRTPARPSASPATSSSCAAATTTTPAATRPTSRAPSASGERSSTRSTGRRTSTTPASASSSSAAARRPSRWCPRWRGPPSHVTMLQRSPTYVISRPAEDASPTRCGAGCRRSSPTASSAGATSRCSCGSSTSRASGRRS